MCFCLTNMGHKCILFSLSIAALLLILLAVEAADQEQQQQKPASSLSQTLFGLSRASRLKVSNSINDQQDITNSDTQQQKSDKNKIDFDDVNDDNSGGDDDDDDDNDDYKDDDDDDLNLSQDSSKMRNKVATTTIASDNVFMKTKVCVTLNPSHVSTRNGPLISYECSASICTDDSQGQPMDDSNEIYRFRRPLFDWNSQLTHLLVTNGSCDSNGFNCWNKIDINIDSLMDAMVDEGMQELEIHCAVADYVHSYNEFNYVYGEASSVLKYFKGNRIHEMCNSTDDCGENLICNRNTDFASSFEDDNDNSAENRFCECLTQKMVTYELSDGSVSTALQSFILVEDPKYHEQVCVPVRSYNESCQYDQQCQAIDLNLYCKPGSTVNQVEVSSLSTCACRYGFQWNLASTPRGRCTRLVNELIENSDQFINAGSNDANNNRETDDTINSTSDDPLTTPNDLVYIWWIFPPSNSDSITSDSDDLAVRNANHGLVYYASRYFTITNLINLMMIVVISLPVVVLVVTLILYCRRHMHNSRQYQHQRASFSSEHHIYYPADCGPYGPPTPNEKFGDKSMSFFGDDYCNTKCNIAPQRSPKSEKKQSKRSNKSEDKVDLVDHDQLEEKTFP